MRNKIWHSLALVTLLTGGIAVLWGFFALWGTSTYESHMRQEMTYEDLVVDARGDAWIQVNQYYNGNSNELQNQLPFRTLEGEPTKVPSHDFWLDRCSLSNPHASWIKTTNELQHDWRRRVTQIASTRKELWYLVHNGAEAEAGRAYLVGYNLRTKMHVGFCGRQGFRAELPTEDQQFRLDGRNTGWGNGNCAVLSSQKAPKIALASQDGWFEFSVKQRRLRTIDDSQSYLSVTTCKITESTPRGTRDKLSDAESKSLHTATERLSLDWPEVFVARRHDSIVVQQPQQEPPLVFVIPEDFRKRSIDFYFISADHVLMSTSKGFRAQHGSLLMTTNAAGEIQKSQPIAWARGPQTDYRLAACFGALGMPSLLVLGILLLGIVPSQPNYQQSDWSDAGYLERVGIVLSDAWPALLALVIISGVLTWLALRWHRQYARPHVGAWAVLVFLLGVPGFIAYWIYHRRPALETCPECGKTTPRDRADCSHCQQAFAEPSLTGTEIFV